MNVYVIGDSISIQYGPFLKGFLGGVMGYARKEGTEAATYNQVADEAMAAAEIPVIDLYTFTLKLGPDLYMDHVHFREPIRKMQAAYIAGWLSAFVSR